MKTIFIIAPHFPPSAMPPSQRVRLLVKNLPDFGYYPVVFTVTHEYREEIADPWMEDLVGTHFDKYETKCFDQRITRKFGIGDLGLRLIPFLFSPLILEARKKKPAFILYPVPPWYIMAMAPVVKWFTGIPYAIDFIDPWVRPLGNENWKSRISQWVARRVEGFSVKRSSAILAVSQGILNDLTKRYPSIEKHPMAAIPYGVELSDYSGMKTKKNLSPGETVFVRYIGALSDSMLPVVKALLKVLLRVHNKTPLKVEFIGTSYAGNGLVLPRIEEIICETQVGHFVTEIPSRVSYRQALELTASADILLLIGDMTPYYAASKLMGLIASQKPFIALLHHDSFPAEFLRELNYKYVTEYESMESEIPESKINEAIDQFHKLISELPIFHAVPLSTQSFRQHTAWSMTQKFINTLQNINK